MFKQYTQFKLNRHFWLIISAGLFLILALTTSVIWLYLNIEEPTFNLSLSPLQMQWRESGHIEPYRPQHGGVAKVWPENNIDIPVLHNGLEQLKRINLNDNKPLYGLTVVVDAGHGGSDPGTIWPPNNNYDKAEKDVTLLVSQRLQKKLQSLGAKVIMLREKDEFISIYRRSAEVGQYILNDYLTQARSVLKPRQLQKLEAINKALSEIITVNKDNFGGILGGIGASSEARLLMDIEKQYTDIVFISVHVNSSTNNYEAGGTQVYLLRSQTLYEAQNIPVYAGSRFGLDYDPQTTVLPFYPLYLNYDDEARQRLGRAIYHEVATAIPNLRTREAKSLLEENFAVLRTCNVPGVLLETGFITNADDREFLWASNSPDILADAVSSSLKTYVELMQRFAR